MIPYRLILIRPHTRNDVLEQSLSVICLNNIGTWERARKESLGQVSMVLRGGPTV